MKKIVLCVTTYSTWRLSKATKHAGLCVLRGFIGMLYRGAYGSAVAKKIKYPSIGMYGYGTNAN